MMYHTEIRRARAIEAKAICNDNTSDYVLQNSLASKRSDRFPHLVGIRFGFELLLMNTRNTGETHENTFPKVRIDLKFAQLDKKWIRCQ